MTKFTLLAVLTLFCGGAAHGKDLSRRLGVGYASPFSLGDTLPSLAARYYPNPDYGLMGAIGVDTTKDDSQFGLMLKMMRTVFREENLNFYVAAAAGLISRQIVGHTDSGFDVDAVIGTEFFFAGLENLGFNFEAGVGVTSISSEVRFRTIGDHPLRAGLFFYF